MNQIKNTTAAPENALPALLGGRPVCSDGPPDWPIADEDVRQALLQAYEDRSWGKYHGGRVGALEAALKEHHDVEFAVTCASGTLAVEVALRGFTVGPGDEVILAAYDYPGNFLSVHAVGAQPVLVDLAANNWNLDPEKVAQAVGPKTKAIIASHLHGGVVPMPQLMEIAAAYRLWVVEDAAQCPGATIEGKKAGTWGDAGVLSFGGSKLLSAGRGGAVLTAHADVDQRIRRVVHRANAVCPLSELQAAVLMPQLTKLNARNARRSDNVRVLHHRLKDLPGLRPFSNLSEQVQPGYYKVGFQYDARRFGLSRSLLVVALRAEGIAFDEGFRALHHGRSPKRFRRGTELTEAEKAHHGALILHHPILLAEAGDVERVAEAIEKIHVNVSRVNEV